ncbi:MAG: hypothetical protein K0Q69_2943 [Devosia sp.]|nr:hypothetical protein [Devosia sp.]
MASVLLTSTFVVANTSGADAGTLDVISRVAVAGMAGIRVDDAGNGSGIEAADVAGEDYGLPVETAGSGILDIGVIGATTPSPGDAVYLAARSCPAKAMPVPSLEHPGKGHSLGGQASLRITW